MLFISLWCRVTVDPKGEGATLFWGGKGGRFHCSGRPPDNYTMRSLKQKAARKRVARALQLW